MTGPRQIQAVRGVRDILPVETPKWQRLDATARAVFEAYGYREIRIPIFERTELFARGIGEDTDIVEKEMYTFQDRSGESMTLRPEATASLLRAYIEHGLHVSPKPVKLYTMGPMFRYERPQAGRYRQFYQINVEALGESRPALDAEVVAMLMGFFGALGLGGRLTLHINSIGDGACRPAYREGLTSYLREHHSELCVECRGRIERNPLRVLDCKNPGCTPILDKAPSILEALCPDCREHFARVQEYLVALGVPYTIDHRMVRGLDYYVRTTFELLAEELGAQNAVAGGGRYDGLIQALGGPTDPGIGFAIGCERVALLIHHDTPQNVPVALAIPLGDQALKALLLPVGVARAKGVWVELAYGARKLKVELDRANRIGTPYVVIMGENELASGEVQLRTMATGQQDAVPLGSLVEELVRRTRSGGHSG